MAQTDFGRVLSKTEVQFKRASEALAQTRLFSEQSNLTAAYEAAFRFEAGPVWPAPGQRRCGG